jgi:hypothetical protein
MMDLIGSDAFLNEIMDAAAALVFSHFGFGGWKEHYTGFCPVWQLSYALPLWAKLLEDDTGCGLPKLFLIPSTESIPFFDPDSIKAIIGRVVKRGIAENNLQPILDVVHEMPCDEDFESWNTNVRKDFLRKWYHTRSKRVQTVSLEACMEDDENGIHEIEDVSSRFEENVLADDFCDHFQARLSKRDMDILTFRKEGFTYEEIAVKMGYKNHSGVIKRMQSIAKAFLRYEDEQR